MGCGSSAITSSPEGHKPQDNRHLQVANLNTYTFVHNPAKKNERKSKDSLVWLEPKSAQHRLQTNPILSPLLKNKREKSIKLPPLGSSTPKVQPRTDSKAFFVPTSLVSIEGAIAAQISQPVLGGQPEIRKRESTPKKTEGKKKADEVQGRQVGRNLNGDASPLPPTGLRKPSSRMQPLKLSSSEVKKMNISELFLASDPDDHESVIGNPGSPITNQPKKSSIEVPSPERIT